MMMPMSAIAASKNLFRHGLRCVFPLLFPTRDSDLQCVPKNAFCFTLLDCLGRRVSVPGFSRSLNNLFLILLVFHSQCKFMKGLG
jgi:hypothetical protein